MFIQIVAMDIVVVCRLLQWKISIILIDLVISKTHFHDTK